MPCFICSRKEHLSEAPFLRENIAIASILLKRTITEEEILNAFTCGQCTKTFFEYVELHQRLASIENAVSAKSSRVGPNVQPDDKNPNTPHSPPVAASMDHTEGQEYFTCINIDPGIEISNVDDELHFADEVVVEEYSFEDQEPPQFNEEVIEQDQDREPSHKNFTKSSRGSYKCNHCAFRLLKRTISETVEAMADHLKEMHYVSVSICSTCVEEFSSPEELADHQTAEHKSIGALQIFSCKACSTNFPTNRELAIHSERCGAGDPKNHNPDWECVYCKKRFGSRAKVEDHLNTHSGVRPYKCEVCSADFSSKYIYSAHLKIHADRPRPFQCKECDRTFLTSQHLQRHQRTHRPEHWECSVCQKVFKLQRNLQQHAVVHSGHRPFRCPFCEKAFARATELKDHKRTHTGEKPFVCDICGMAFAQISNMTTHKKTIHENEEKFQCGTCARTFKRRRLLDGHIKGVHLNERSIQCDLCPQTFVYAEALRKHLQSVHARRPPKKACELCGKAFHTNEARNTHRFVHSSKQMYECVVCEKGFMRRPKLVAHMQQSGHKSDAIMINRLHVNEAAELVTENIMVPLADFMTGEGKSEQDLVSEQDEKSSPVVVMEDWEKSDTMLSGYNSLLSE